jgi:hypothetical protein
MQSGQMGRLPFGLMSAAGMVTKASFDNAASLSEK